MKKSLLIILSLFIFGFSFAKESSSQNFLLEENPSDTSITNFYEQQKLKLYPNPVKDYLFIEYDVLFVKDAKLKIYNSIGAVIYSKNLEDKQDKLKLSVSDYNNGLYFCSLQIDGKLLNTKKILINHR
ncbi:MAG: T9SS type A sorting domain-containing protein [Bacteroidales bacterium]|nr:T9SS type A sorting domain-containing protein [Bacteroidales bacterium]